MTNQFKSLLFPVLCACLFAFTNSARAGGHNGDPPASGGNNTPLSKYWEYDECVGPVLTGDNLVVKSLLGTGSKYGVKMAPVAEGTWEEATFIETAVMFDGKKHLSERKAKATQTAMPGDPKRKIIVSKLYSMEMDARNDYPGNTGKMNRQGIVIADEGKLVELWIDTLASDPKRPILQVGKKCFKDGAKKEDPAFGFDVDTTLSNPGDPIFPPRTRLPNDVYEDVKTFSGTQNRSRLDDAKVLEALLAKDEFKETRAYKLDPMYQLRQKVFELVSAAK